MKQVDVSVPSIVLVEPQTSSVPELLPPTVNNTPIVDDDLNGVNAAEQQSIIPPITPPLRYHLQEATTKQINNQPISIVPPSNQLQSIMKRMRHRINGSAVSLSGVSLMDVADDVTEHPSPVETSESNIPYIVHIGL
jgi:hypothetical protein